MMQHRKSVKNHPQSVLIPTIYNFKHSGNLRFIFISMASLLSLILSLLLFFYLSSSVSGRQETHKPAVKLSPPNTSDNIIREACKASRYPPTCEASLVQSNHVPPDATILQVIQSAMWVSAQNLEKAKSMVREILDASIGNQNRLNAAKTCLEVLHYSEYRMALTNDALPRGKIKDARAWMSAVLVFQYDCWSALKYVNGTSQIGKTMAFLNSLIRLSSNALGMMVNYDNFGEKTRSWGPPKTERDGFWEGRSGSSGSEFVGGVPKGLKPDVTVCNGGRCHYKAIQDAVNAVPKNAGVGNRFVIWIKAGVYEEMVRVPLEKKNVVFLGDGMGKTVITGSMNAGQPGMSTYNSATVGVAGDGFMASGLTIQNTAGPGAHQAVAFRLDSDLSVIENCEFLGNQDTLYAHSLRQYYKSCRIQGNVDFIFGNSAAFFQDCFILVAPRQIKPEKGENNAVTAHGRIDPAQFTGFVFQNCIINGTEAYMALYYRKPSVHKNFLGRPWKEYSRTVFMHCTLEDLIKPEGWMPWRGDFALKTLYYGEFKNYGPGANASQRVAWRNLKLECEEEKELTKNLKP
ncbi:probable pectinesterase/pectinesterase inhibitor 51 [Olea europaea var. sylvestris]|uniref:probable pectinesterase/pectinesterase inhibitor 51 n=1 Tax=Olea europaea var. sylvestris TaxID=158386 RepID=UPI000C1D3957|nr:probable pectinesterase/pectinesterase inhibitor 51 [Olea europaea var. sylvestris]